MFFKKKVKKDLIPATNVTLGTFNDLVVNNDQIVVLDFWAPWCGPCKVMGPILDELATEYEGEALIGKVNVDRERELSAQFQVRSIPALFFIKNGEIVEHFNGIVPKPNMKKILDQYKNT